MTAVWPLPRPVPMDKRPVHHEVLFSIFLIGVIALVTRSAYLMTPAGMFGGGDESIFGLMAHRILAGEECPIFCWGAHYAGAPVSYGAAFLFTFLEPGFVPLRLVMLPLAVATPVLFYLIYRSVLGQGPALTAGLCLVFCPFLIGYLGMAALGGYGELFFGTALIIWLSGKPQQNGNGHVLVRCVFLGVLSGFFLYITFFMVPVIASFVLPALWHPKEGRRKSILSWTFGFLAGASPLIYYNVILCPGCTLTRAASHTLHAGREVLSMTPLAGFLYLLQQRLSAALTWFEVLPVNVGWLLLPGPDESALMQASGVAFLGLTAWYMLSVSRSRSDRSEGELRKLRQFACLAGLFLVFCFLAKLDGARHFSLLFFVLPVMLYSVAGQSAWGKKAVTAGLCLLCVFHAMDAAERVRKPGFDPYPVVEAMRKRNILEFHGSYESVYPLMFAGHPELSGSPTLIGPRQGFPDRCPASTEKVRRSSAPSYIFLARERRLQDDFEQFLHQRNIAYERVEIDGTNVVFNLSSPVEVDVTSGSGCRFIVRTAS
jgi:hypothetical protein